MYFRMGTAPEYYENRRRNGTKQVRTRPAAVHRATSVTAAAERERGSDGARERAERYRRSGAIRAASSPTMPRRNVSTHTTKITPCATVTQAPNCDR